MLGQPRSPRRAEPNGGMLCAQPDVQTEVLAVVDQHPLHRWWAAAVVGEADLVRVTVRVRVRVRVR